jgi:hypothetical protein
MQPITISLCAETHKLAKDKTNFSAWVRDQLRSERNKREVMNDNTPWKYCYSCDKSQKTHALTCQYKHCKDVFVAILEDLEA